MTKSRKVWLVCGAAMGLPLTGVAQNVRQVQVTENKGLVEVHVIGSNLSKPTDVTWQKDFAYTLEWQAGLQSPGGQIRVDGKDVKSVWYGWYKAHPKAMRVQIKTNKLMSPEVVQSPDGWVVKFAEKAPEVAIASKSAPALSILKDSVHTGLLATVLGETSHKIKPVSRVSLSKDDTSPSSSKNRVALSLPDPAAAKLVAMNIPAKPFVEMSPVLKRWATLEKLQKEQVTKPIVKTKLVAQLPNATMPNATLPNAAMPGTVPIEVVPRGQYHRVTLDCSNADLTQVLKGLALQSGANIVIGPSVSGKVTADLHDVTIEQALKYVSYLTGIKYEVNDGIYMFGVVPPAPTPIQNNSSSFVNRTILIHSEQEEVVKKVLLSQFRNDLIIEVSSQRTSNSSQVADPAIKGEGGAGSTESRTNIQSEMHFIVLVGEPDVVDAAAKVAKSIDSELLHGYQIEQDNLELRPYDVKFADPRALRESLITQVQGLTVVIAPNSVGAFQGYKEGKTKAQALDKLVTDALAQNAATAPGQNAAASAGVGAVGSVNTTSANDSALEQPFTAEEAISVPMKLILRGTHAQIEQALAYANVLDTSPKQVALELRVMELTKQDALNAGLDWSIATGGAVSVVNLNNAAPVLPNSTASAPNNSATINLGSGKTKATVTATLDQLASKNKLVARPNLIAMDGRQSEVFIGDIIRYVESITQSQNGTTVTTGEVPVGVRLSVLPRVGADGNMTLDLRPRISLLTSFTPVEGGGELPQTSTRFAQSTVSLQSGQTIAIGGLIQDQDVKTLTGLPILMNLPIIGSLFRSTVLNHERTELVIFVTAKTIDGPVGPEALPMIKALENRQAVLSHR